MRGYGTVKVRSESSDSRWYNTLALSNKAEMLDIHIEVAISLIGPKQTMSFADYVTMETIVDRMTTDEPGRLLAKLTKKAHALRIKLCVLREIFRDVVKTLGVTEKLLGVHILNALVNHEDGQAQRPYANTIKKRSQFSLNRDSNSFCIFIPWDKADVTPEDIITILSCIPMPSKKMKTERAMTAPPDSAHPLAIAELPEAAATTSTYDEGQGGGVYLPEPRSACDGRARPNYNEEPFLRCQQQHIANLIPEDFKKKLDIPSFVFQWYLERFGLGYLDKADGFVSDWFTQSDVSLQNLEDRIKGYISYKEIDAKVVTDWAATCFMVSPTQAFFTNKVIGTILRTYQTMLKAAWADDSTIPTASFSSNSEALDWVKKNFIDGANFVVIKEQCQRHPSLFISSLLGTKVQPAFVLFHQGQDHHTRAHIHTYDMIWLGLVMEVLVNKVFAATLQLQSELQNFKHPFSSPRHYALWHAAIRWNWPKQKALYKKCRVPYAHDIFPLDCNNNVSSGSTGVELAYQSMGLLKVENNYKFLSSLYPPAPAVTGPYFIKEGMVYIDLPKARQWVKLGGPVDSSVLLLMDDLIGAEVNSDIPMRCQVDLGVGITMPVGVWSTLYTSTQYHVEDMGLSAMNVLYDGAIKLWLVAPTQDVADAFYMKLGRKTKEFLEKK